MNTKKSLLILGKLPPPYYGTSVSMEILINSSLKELYNLSHVDTNVHKSIDTLGNFRSRKIIDNILIYRTLYKKIKKHKPDVVIIPISQTTLGYAKDSIFILIAAFLNTKILLHLHGSNLVNWLRESNFLVRGYVNYTFKKCAGAIVLGTNLKYLFSSFFKEENIYVVPNGADIQVQNSHKEKGIFNILYLGNLQPSKGIEDLIDCLVILKEEYHLNFSATIVGAWRDDVTKTYCLSAVEKHSLNVVFSGALIGEEKMKCYEQADVFVFTPREPEGHPWVIVEAMASSLPIITTNQGAIVESVIDGENGFIVDKFTPYEIADKLQLLINNDVVRKQMAMNSRLLYEQKFTEEAMIKNLTIAINHIANSTK